MVLETLEDKIDSLFEWADDHFLAGDFHIVDKYLTEVSPETLELDLVVAVLSITNVARDHLPSRGGFVEKSRTYLSKVCPDRVDNLLLGLE